MKKRIISALLAMCLLLGLLSTTAWAAAPIADGNGDYSETEGQV